MGDGKTDWEVVGAKLQPDLYEQVQQHKEEEGHSTESENIRALIRKGLESGSGKVTPPIAVIWVGSILVSSALNWQFQTVSTDGIAALGFVLIAGAAAYRFIRRNY